MQFDANGNVIEVPHHLGQCLSNMAVADKIAEKYGQDEANRCFSNDFFPKSLARVVGPENRVSLLS